MLCNLNMRPSAWTADAVGAAKEAAALGALRLLRAGFERDEDVVHALRRAEAGVKVFRTLHVSDRTLRHEPEPRALEPAQADNKHRPLRSIPVLEHARHTHPMLVSAAVLIIRDIRQPRAVPCLCKLDCMWRLSKQFVMVGTIVGVRPELQTCGGVDQAPMELSASTK